MFNQQSGVCPYCGEEMTLDLGENNTATIEHIIPRSKGGPSAEFNYMAVCSSCNFERGNKPLGVYLIGKRKMVAEEAKALRYSYG
jgi:5-methylcytosine-specific restriction endonuclease McrA